MSGQRHEGSEKLKVKMDRRVAPNKWFTLGARGGQVNGTGRRESVQGRAQVGIRI